MNKLMLITLLILPTILFAQRKLQFIGENIDFEINEKTFSTNGIYYFLNNTESEIERTILFPFSDQADSLHIIRVYNLSYLKSIVYKQQDNAISFRINILPNDTIRVNIVYTQKAENKNVYILESTQTWGQPLKRAFYSLKGDSTVLLDSLSLKPDTFKNNTYYWEKFNFYPNDNFTIWIQ
jgi:hypothetical protein